MVLFKENVSVIDENYAVILLWKILNIFLELELQLLMMLL